jgi:predicted nuclease with RNAse H fold
MADWLYLFTANKEYPDPLAEIAVLGALHEERPDEPVFLLLAQKDAPPMKNAQPGEEILLCTRPRSWELRRHGTAVVAGEPQQWEEPPPRVRDLYGDRQGRFFVPLSPIRLEQERSVEELTEEEQRSFARGEAYVRRLKPRGRASRLRPLGIPPPPPSPFPVPVFPRQAVTPSTRPHPVWLLGLDPTAGKWEVAMRSGDKDMPSFCLVLHPDGTVRPDEDPLAWHTSNEDFWQRVRRTSAAVTCIDGPCATNGPRVLPDWSGWDPNSPDGVREGERALAREGVGLFWTTRASVLRFRGVDRWIARSIRLFQETPPGVSAIETHPHGAFSFLWAAFGCRERLPTKNTPEGKRARLALLQAYVPDLKEKSLPNHDAIDAACAALVAVLHVSGLTKAYGTPQDGGPIWMPTPDGIDLR